MSAARADDLVGEASRSQPDSQPGPRPSQPAYGIVVAKDVMVPMRDGVRLATDIYRPADPHAGTGEIVPGRWPTILARTSYDKTTVPMWVAPVGEWFCRQGYVVAIQDLRGRQKSEGTGQYFHTANPSEGPDGYDPILADSILRVRYRESWERATLMTPGQVYPIEIPLPPTSNLFTAGHRIRIDISSSSFPRFDLNPDTGEPVGRHTEVRTARNTVYLDAAHPSQVVLPIIPPPVK